MTDCYLFNNQDFSPLLMIYMLWFNFILGSNFLSFCFKLIIMLLSYITIPKTKEKEIWTKDNIETQHFFFFSRPLCVIEQCYYRAFSLTLPASMQICWIKEKSLSSTGLVWDTNIAVACSRRSKDGGKRCFHFFALLFAFDRSCQSERLEQANMAAVSLFWHTNMEDETPHENPLRGLS